MTMDIVAVVKGLPDSALLSPIGSEFFQLFLVFVTELSGENTLILAKQVRLETFAGFGIPVGRGDIGAAGPDTDRT